MPVTNDITQTNPVVDADFDTWGAKQNNFFDQVRSTVGALVSQFNALQTASANFLSRAGGTMTGDQVLFAGGPTDARSSGYRGAPVSSFDADKALVLADAGVTQRLTGSTGRTLTIPPVGSVGFPVGTVIPIRVSSSASLVVARGSGVQLRLAGSTTDANRTVATQGLATIMHEDTNVWVISGIGIS